MRAFALRILALGIHRASAERMALLNLTMRVPSTTSMRERARLGPKQRVRMEKMRSAPALEGFMAKDCAGSLGPCAEVLRVVLPEGENALRKLLGVGGVQHARINVGNGLLVL